MDTGKRILWAWKAPAIGQKVEWDYAPNRVLVIARVEYAHAGAYLLTLNTLEGGLIARRVRADSCRPLTNNLSPCNF
jgi:hypothetical protein